MAKTPTYLFLSLTPLCRLPIFPLMRVQTFLAVLAAMSVLLMVTIIVISKLNPSVNFFALYIITVGMVYAIIIGCSFSIAGRKVLFAGKYKRGGNNGGRGGEK